MVETINVQTVSEFEAETKRARIVLVDFYAEWCGPCRYIAPILEELEKEYADQYPPLDDVKQFALLKLDVDKSMQVARELEISAMPTFHFYNEGKLVETVVGANPVKIKEVCKNMLSGEKAAEVLEAIEEVTEPAAVQ